MKTAHITAFAAAIAGRRRSAEDDISRCKDRLDDARDALGATEETIRAHERQLEDLRRFHAESLEDIQRLEAHLTWLFRRSEACSALLVDADSPSPPHPGEARGAVSKDGLGGRPTAPDATAAGGTAARFARHLRPNGAA